MPEISGFEATLHERLRKSDLFRVYQNAFRTATGLPLRLVGANPEDWCMDEESVNRSPFCEVLNLSRNACHACVETNRRLMNEARVSGPSSCQCFAGLSASAVPIRAGTTTVGFLKTGQVLSRQPDEAQFERVLSILGRKTLNEQTTRLLRDAYLQTRAVEPERYTGMIALLKNFSDQLGNHAESLAIIEEGREPAAIARARRYIHARLHRPLPLGDVAKEAGLSDSHFCRVFKETTGLTLTGYVGRCRIEWGKEELLKSSKRISEVAFEVGYQSLSQFNRSFVRIAGMSPSAWRKRQLAG
jgi:AraC-like DNA-binding protein